MRLLMPALLGLTLAVAPAAAIARTDPGHSAHGPAGKASGARAPVVKAPMLKAPVAKAQAAAPRARTAAAQGPARLQQVAWRPAAAPAACSAKARNCRGTTVAKVQFGWTQGLPAAAGVQANECPDGTMATLARGHDDVVRCMPI